MSDQTRKEFIEQYCRYRSITPEYFKQRFICSRIGNAWRVRVKGSVRP